eukprot:3270164-Pyramimonas_sp.AAC.1
MVEQQRFSHGKRIHPKHASLPYTSKPCVGSPDNSVPKSDDLVGSAARRRGQDLFVPMSCGAVEPFRGQRGATGLRVTREIDGFRREKRSLLRAAAALSRNRQPARPGVSLSQGGALRRTAP